MSKIKAKIVVGLGYGDEGKGLTVNELCKKAENPVVVRFSAGQQCGHTVHMGDIKHIFSNFGSGTLQNVPTYFTEHTCFYPVTILREKKVLESKGIKEPILVIHPMAKMTTPYDVYANRNCDDNLSHGTCGLGIGKTEKRHRDNYTLHAIDLMHRSIFEAKMASIKEYYDMKTEPTWFEQEMQDFEEAIDLMEDTIGIAGYDFLTDFKTLVFEGSQGILLDKDHGVFPNVTYSNTTSKNAMEVCDILKIKKRKVYCVTRAYSTRHGNGIYVEEPIALKDAHHETNEINEYQGVFKTANLDHGLVAYAHQIENLYSSGYNYTLVVTCANQVEEEFDPMLLETNWNDLKMSYSVYGEFKNHY